MSFIRFILDRHQFTLVVLMLLAALGLSSYFTMPRAEDPQFNFPAATVIVIYPGASPEDVEQLVADPLEESINELEDLKKVQTTIRDGVAVTFVEFFQGVDPDDALSDVQDAVKNAERVLPSEIADVQVLQQSPSDVNILQVALISAEANYGLLRREAERLEQTFEQIPLIKRAETWAFPDEEVHIALDFERMRTSGIALPEVIRAIQTTGANIPGGDLDVGRSRYNVKTSGDYDSLEDIRRTVVRGSGQSTVYLEQIAEVDFGFADESYRARVNGERAVFVTAVQREGTNIHDVSALARDALAGFERFVPEEIRVETVFEQEESVSERVGGFFANLFQGVLLVGIIVFLAMGLRSAGIVMLAIPFSLLIAIGWLDFSGFGLQQMSIVGLVIALGLLVDNAIVVTENVERFKGMGLSSREAALKGAGQVAGPIISATVTTILSFLPMVLLQTGTGDFIRSMPLMVIFALGASLIVSLTLTPLLAGTSRRKTVASAERKTTWFNRQLEKIAQGRYTRRLRQVVARPGLVITAAVIVFAGSMALFPLVGVSLFPRAEKPYLMVNVDLPEGASLDRTDAVTREVEAILSESDGITDLITNVGHGNPRIYYNVFPERDNTAHAQIIARLTSASPTEITERVEVLRNRMGQIPGAQIQVKEFMQGPPVEAPIAISIVGNDLDVLRNEAARIEEVLSDLPGTIDVDNPFERFKTDLRVDINRDKAGLLGVSLDAVDLTVRSGLAGIPVTSFRDGQGEDYDVVVGLPSEGRPGIDAFDRLHVVSNLGGTVPVRQVASLSFESSPSLILHRDMERIATVTADVVAGANVAVATAAAMDVLSEVNLPAGYRYLVGGEEESRAESFGGMGQALLIALLGIFAVLVLQFRSFRQPGIVFAAIPFAITGAVLALLITGYTFSFTAFIGLTSLVGIVVNNSIILVDYANQLLEDGRSVIDAIVEAGQTRFLPIILTTLTTIGGLLPLTLTGSSMWAPMGWAIIGGLIVSTVLTLVVVPALYALLTEAPQAEIM